MVRIDGGAVGREGIAARRRLGAAFVPEERLGHADVSTTMVSTHVLQRGAGGVVSPLDRP